jgi:hypothetical protein
MMEFHLAPTILHTDYATMSVSGTLHGSETVYAFASGSGHNLLCVVMEIKSFFPKKKLRQFNNVASCVC